VLGFGITVLRADGAPPAEEMAKVHEASAVVAYAHIFDTPFPHAEARAKWASHPGEVWLAKRGQTLVGFATANGPELDGLFVLPNEQGQGIGAALLAAVPAVARLWVLEDAAQARRWYEQRGWRATAERQKAYGVWEFQYVR
jgi:GNAT superfamily N-acetyltransferase